MSSMGHRKTPLKNHPREVAKKCVETYSPTNSAVAQRRGNENKEG